jgi:hypothetical protein
MRGQPLAILIALTLSAVSACADVDSGANQPFRVRGAQFIAGPLPGIPPADEDEADDAFGEPRITALDTANLTVFQGQGGKSFSGRAEPSASAIAVRLAGAGTGYWVLPTGAPDTATGELSYSFSADFDTSIAPGRHVLHVVAISEDGLGGERLELELCVSGRVPDNGSACTAEQQPPRTVISLQWDSNVDLDLQVVGPDGELIGSKSAAADSGSAQPKLDRDSNANCSVDGLRTENVVWNNQTPEGLYTVYVNLFDACKQPSVRFSVDVLTWDGDPDSLLTRQLHKSGELLDSAAEPGAARGLFVAQVSFN